MELRIDGRAITPQPGQSLLDLVKLLGLDSETLSERPLAAKIAGEVFTLNYIPVRQQQEALERRAMEASRGEIHLLRFSDPQGRDSYDRSARFVLFLALRMLYPTVQAKLGCTIGAGTFVETEGEIDLSALKAKMRELVSQDIPLLRRRLSTPEAMQFFRQQGQPDKERLLADRQAESFDSYFYDDYADYFYGEMVPSTGYIQVWEILPAPGGFVFVFPTVENPDTPAAYEEKPHYLSVCSEAKDWGELMECETVADLNALTRSGSLRELIRVNEALHEKRFSEIADAVVARNARLVMLAGPSSSGKTTSAHRLATQLRVHGKKPILMSLDDFYVNRDTMTPGPDGKLDFEHINAIDGALFTETMTRLLEGEAVQLPEFIFRTGQRVWRKEQMQLEPRSVIIVEGLHALNPSLLPKGIPAEQVFRLYVCPMLALNLDHHNRVHSSYLRLLRRIVRDYETRGYGVQQTLGMWDSVRRGEERWIYPYEENADVILNSATLYELAILKRHIFPLLTAIGPEEDCYDAVRSVVKVLNYVQEADVDDEIPPTSLVREFIGGNRFYG